MANYLELLASLVNIDSGTYDCEGIGKVAVKLGRELVPLGFEMKTHTSRNGSKYYYASIILSGEEN